MLNKVFELICGFGPQQGSVGSCISQGKGQSMNFQSRIYMQGQAQIAKAFGTCNAKIMAMPTGVLVQRMSNTDTVISFSKMHFRKTTFRS